MCKSQEYLLYPTQNIDIVIELSQKMIIIIKLFYIIAH